MKPLLTVLCAASLAALGQASDLRHQVMPYPAASFYSGTASQACVGQFTDDTVPDAAALIGSAVSLAYAPERHASFLKLQGPFTAMTKVSLGSTGRDGLLVSSTAGLALVSWNATTRQLVSTTVYANAVWAGARRLETVRIGTSPVEHICALSASGNKLLTIDWNGSQIVTSTSKSLVLTNPAIAMAGVDWNGDALPDFAYDTGTGLKVVSSSGTQLFAYANTCASPQLLRYPVSGTTDDVIWVTQNPAAPGQALTVAHSTTNLLEPAMAAAPWGIANLALAKFTNSGTSDLVFTRSDDHFAQVLFHQQSGPYSFGFFGPGGGSLAPSLDLTGVWSSGSAPVAAVGDLDGDGDDDLYFVGQPASSGAAGVWFGAVFDEESADGNKFVKPWINWGEYVDWMYPEAPLPPALDTATLTVEFWGNSTSPLLATATEARVTIWVRDADPGPVSPVAIVDNFYSRTTSQVSIPIPLPADVGHGLPRFLDIEFSYVERDASGGAVLHSYPSWTGQIDREIGLSHMVFAGSTTTGGIIRPPPPPTPPGSSSSP